MSWHIARQRQEEFEAFIRTIGPGPPTQKEIKDMLELKEALAGARILDEFYIDDETTLIATAIQLEPTLQDILDEADRIGALPPEQRANMKRYLADRIDAALGPSGYAPHQLRNEEFTIIFVRAVHRRCGCGG